jgi:hypothetical protein
LLHRLAPSLLSGALLLTAWFALAAPSVGASDGAAGLDGHRPHSASVVARGVLAPPAQPLTPTATVAASPTLPPTALPSATPTLAPTETPFPSATATLVPPSATPLPAATATTALPTVAEDRPILVVDRVHVRPDRPAPGQAFELDIDVQNVGDSEALDVRMQWSADVFLPDRGSSEVYRDRIKPGEERDFETGLRVAAGAPAGSHPIAVTFTWRDADGVEDSLQTTVAVEVVGAGATRPQVVVTGSRVPARVAPGSPFTAAFDLQNVGGKEARTIQLVPTSGPLALQGSGQAAPITLPPGGTATLSLRLVAAAPGAPGPTQQAFELRYDDAEGERYTDGVSVGLSVTDDAAYGPMPMILRYEVIGNVQPGEVFELELEIGNVGVADAQRTMLVLGGGGGAGGGGASLGVFAPLDQSNRRFLDRIAAGEQTTVRQRMVVDGAAKPGVYVLDVALSYFDADGEPLNSSEVVSLLVSRKVSLQVNALEIVTQTMVGLPVQLVAEIINTGSATVKVGNVRVVGGRYMDVESTPYFVGALDEGGADVVEATLLPRAPSQEAEVHVVADYTDDFNQSRAYTQTYRFVIEDAPEIEEDLELPEPLPERSFFARLLRGLFGLGASPAPDMPTAEPEMGDAFEPPSRSEPVQIEVEDGP